MEMVVVLSQNHIPDSGIIGGTANAQGILKGISVVGVQIIDNVFGGGNAAEVRGNTNVTIGQ